MFLHHSRELRTKTTASNLWLWLLLALVSTGFGSCKSQNEAAGGHEQETLSRTEFTRRIENFFEYEPLKAGKPSQFLIHLTDLSDGSPVEKAEVTLTVRARGGRQQVGQTTARVGKVTGIYVADLTIRRPGGYDIEFHVRNPKLDERLPLGGFEVK
ncbi:MAG: hypothetical protein ACR2L2_07395 [Acidobacteriota bacterium]